MGALPASRDSGMWNAARPDSPRLPGTITSLASLLLKVCPMRHLPRFLSAPAITLLTLPFLACDPIASMKGTVNRPSGAPVAGAKVSITCSSLDGGGIGATTDTQGEFSARKIGCIEKDCDIDVAILGEPVRHFPSADHCISGGPDCCRVIQANLIVPEAGSS